MTETRYNHRNCGPFKSSDSPWDSAKWQHPPCWPFKGPGKQLEEMRSVGENHRERVGWNTRREHDLAPEELPLTIGGCAGQVPGLLTCLEWPKKLKFSKRSPGIWMLAPYFTKARSTPTAQPATHAEPTPSASFLPCTGSAQRAPCQGFALRCWSSVWKCSRLGSNCLLSVVNLRCWRMVTELGTRLLPCLLLQFTQLSVDCTSELSHILSVGISVLLAKVLPRLCIAPGCILSPFYLVHFFSLPITQSASWDKSKVLVITSLFPSSPKPDLSAS